MTTVKVKLGIRSYPIIIGTGAVKRLARAMPRRPSHIRCFTFFDAGVYPLYHTIVNRSLSGKRIQSSEFVLPSGEQSKSAEAAGALYDFLLDQQVSRSDFILAVGGGVVSDVVGYVAATTMRGIHWGILPTTLLSMVDAAIGGKTGINHRSGKNLIGAFWQPRFVVCDLDFLRTLAQRDLVAGLGEIVKYAGLIGEPMLSLVQRYLEKGELHDENMLQSLVQKSAAFKGAIVAADEHDNGRRAVLNLGHTFAHGVEHSMGYAELRHGEAVVLGLLAATELSSRYWKSAAKYLVPYRRIIEQVMRFVPKTRIDIDKALAAMSVDKKRVSQVQRFVLLSRPGSPHIISDVSPNAARKSLEAALHTYESIGGVNATHSGR
jgi:3-dehydroquinate synthase